MLRLSKQFKSPGVPVKIIDEIWSGIHPSLKPVRFPWVGGGTSGALCDLRGRPWVHIALGITDQRWINYLHKLVLMRRVQNILLLITWFENIRESMQSNRCSPAWNSLISCSQMMQLLKLTLLCMSFIFIRQSNVGSREEGSKQLILHEQRDYILHIGLTQAPACVQAPLVPPVEWKLLLKPRCLSAFLIPGTLPVLAYPIFTLLL